MSQLQINKHCNAQFLCKSVDPNNHAIVVPLTNCVKATFSIITNPDAGVYAKPSTSVYALQLNSTTNPTQVIINTTAGTVTIYIKPTDVTNIKCGIYQYDVQLLFSDGTILPLIKDFLDVIDSVTASVTVPPYHYRLEDITVQMVKDYYKSSTNTLNEEQIAMLIPQVIDLIKAKTRRDWKFKSVVESNNALGPLPAVGLNIPIPIPTGAEVYESPRVHQWQASFFTKFKPVSNIVVWEDTNILRENTDYVVYRDTGEIRKLVNYMFAIYPTYGNNFYYFNYSYWTNVPGKIQVSYDTGAYPPQDLIHVALEIIGIRAGLKTRTYLSGGIVQTVKLTEITKELWNTLEFHKKIRV